MATTRRRRSGPVASVPGRQAPPATSPTSPPPGSYDPAIDAQVGQAERGLQDFLSDYIRDWGEPGTALGGRQGEDYRLGQQRLGMRHGWGLQDLDIGSGRSLADLERRSGRSLADLERSSGRTLADLLRDRGRGTEDYGERIGGLNRSYQRLGDSQRQTTIARGAQRGGALAQALQKRAVNKAIDRKPIDTGYNRFMADSRQTEGRVNEDTALSRGRINEDTGLFRTRINEDTARGRDRLNQGYQFDVGSLNRSYLRGGEDSATALARAQRENREFGLDANKQRLYQADTILPNLTRRRSIRRTR